MLRRTLFLLILMAGCSSQPNPSALPRGTFVDDYSIEYVILDSSWTMVPGSAYVIDSVDPKERTLILRQPASDSTAVRFTRVDWMILEGMDPWTWAYCYTGWDLATFDEAASLAPANRAEPRTGCGGFPFSRMQSNQ